MLALKVILLSNLKRGTTKSCGCGHRGRPLGKFYTPSGQNNSKRVIAAYKHSAKNRELTFNLSDSQIYDLCQRNCYYCGASPSNIKNDKRCNGVFIYNGIDRMDNTKGYTLNNVQSCCRQCNTAKNILSINEFKDWIKKVYNNVNGI